MHILYKYPTRQRFDKAIARINEIGAMSSNDNYTVLLSVDQDDSPTMQRLSELFGVTLDVDLSPSKIHAINRNMHLAPEWDIVVVMSDDMVCQVPHFDKIIREQMALNFPDLDGVLWFHDGYQKDICTLTIMGRKYYERFNYLYHPDYLSLWCDNELTEVAKELGKIKFIDQVLFKHEHPAWNNNQTRFDALYARNEALFDRDHEVYLERKKRNFDLIVKQPLFPEK